jgi:hypothetical protein
LEEDNNKPGVSEGGALITRWGREMTTDAAATKHCSQSINIDYNK